MNPIYCTHPWCTNRAELYVKRPEPYSAHHNVCYDHYVLFRPMYRWMRDQGHATFKIGEYLEHEEYLKSREVSSARKIDTNLCMHCNSDATHYYVLHHGYDSKYRIYRHCEAHYQERFVLLVTKDFPSDFLNSIHFDSKEAMEAKVKELIDTGYTEEI